MRKKILFQFRVFLKKNCLLFGLSLSHFFRLPTASDDAWKDWESLETVFLSGNIKLGLAAGSLGEIFLLPSVRQLFMNGIGLHEIPKSIGGCHSVEVNIILKSYNRAFHI